MGVFNKTPYTNFHELNLNWIIKKIKEVAADNTFFKQFFKYVEDEHILGVVTDVTENNDNTVNIDYWNEDTQLMDDYTVYNKTGTDGAISGAVSPIADRVTTAEGDISTLQGQMTNAIQPYNNETNFATDLNALPLKAVFVRIGPETLNSPLPSNQGYCLSIRSSANWGSQMAQTNNSEIVWVRKCQNGTWSSWRQLAYETEILTPVQIQLTLPSTVTVPAGGTANLLQAVDPATLTKSATLHGDTIPAGRELYGAVFLWTNSSVCTMTNCLVEANNKLTVTVYNHSANPVSASGIRLLLFYK